MTNIHDLPSSPWRAQALVSMSPADMGQAFQGEDAAEWLDAATGSGLVEAQLRLGRMLLTGEGFPMDRRAAFACFFTAARGGNAEAQNLVGRCYENGWGVGVDRHAARACYREAAELGDYRGAHIMPASWRPKAASPAHCTGLPRGSGTRRSPTAPPCWNLFFIIRAAPSAPLPGVRSKAPPLYPAANPA